MFVIINNFGIMIHADVFGILVPANVNLINHVMLEDHENCKCRKTLVDKLVEVCSAEIDGNEIIYNATMKTYTILVQYT